MTSPRGLNAVLAWALVVTPLALSPSASTASAHEVTRPAGDLTLIEDAPLLNEPRRGEKAIRELGADIAVAAARNDMRPGELRGLLREDRTAWVDTEGLPTLHRPAAR